MTEIDITDSVKRNLRYTVAGVLVMVAAIVGLVFVWQSNNAYVALHGGEVVGNLVKVKNKVPGAVTEILVMDGQLVEAGLPLAKMRVEVSPEERAQLKKILETAKARYDEILTRPVSPALPRSENGGAMNQAAEETLNRAKLEKEKMDKLFAIGGISRAKHEEAAARYESAYRNYQTAQIRQSAAVANEPADSANKETSLKLAALQIKQAEAALAKAEGEQIVEIQATVDGIVYLMNIQTEQELAEEEELFAIGNARDIWVEAPISEGQKEKISLGQFVQYTIADYPHRHFCGTVYEIIEPSGKADGNPGQKSVVRISVPADLDIHFKPGMKVNAKISV